MAKLFTRRDFLKDTAAAAATGVYVLKSSRANSQDNLVLRVREDPIWIKDDGTDYITLAFKKRN